MAPSLSTLSVKRIQLLIYPRKHFSKVRQPSLPYASPIIPSILTNSPSLFPPHTRHYCLLNSQKGILERGKNKSVPTTQTLHHHPLILISPSQKPQPSPPSNHDSSLCPLPAPAPPPCHGSLHPPLYHLLIIYSAATAIGSYAIQFAAALKHPPTH